MQIKKKYQKIKCVGFIYKILIEMNENGTEIQSQQIEEILTRLNVGT